MPLENIEIRPIKFEEFAEWEPLWKGYQAFHLKNNCMVLLAFRL